MKLLHKDRQSLAPCSLNLNYHSFEILMDGYYINIHYQVSHPSYLKRHSDALSSKVWFETVASLASALSN